MRLVRLKRGVRPFGAMCATVAVFGFPCCAQAVAGLPACEAMSPTIDSVTLKDVTMAGVTLEAQINPEGNETSYEFLIIWRALKPRERGEPLPGSSPAQAGHIDTGMSDVTVSAFLSGLQPGYTYWYQVVATSLGNSTRSEATALPYFNPDWYYSGFEEGPPYAPPVRAGCLNESGNLAAEETVSEQRSKEAEEVAVKRREAAAKEAEEATLKRRAGEHPDAILPARTAENGASGCTVPGVTGDTLSAARRAIDHAHCRLGRVRRPSHYRGALIVTGQAPHRGMMLRNGASVTLVLREKVTAARTAQSARKPRGRGDTVLQRHPIALLRTERR
jgi:hypothetical protein